MGFNVEFRDKDGNVIGWPRLDKEVCELWGVEQDSERWAIPPGKEPRHNWHGFLGRAIILTRAYRETGTFLPSDLLQGLCSFGRMAPNLESIEKHKHELQLILFWMSQEYRIIVTNRW